MRSTILPGFIGAILMIVGLTACQTAPPPVGTSVSVVPPELTDSKYLHEIVRYLYRWHLDENDEEKVEGASQMVFWIRRVDAKFDAGDKSIDAEIILPQLGVWVELKNANYVIEELETQVSSGGFKVTDVRRAPVPAQPPRGYQVVALDMQEMLDSLFKTRNQHNYADAALVEHMRRTLRQEAASEKLIVEIPKEDPVVHLAPLSPVSNETWVFWEAGRKLFYFSSDQDMSKPAVWDQHAMKVEIYDLDQQVVVSHEEAPGSNRFLTRLEASRILYNCVVLGQRITLPRYVPPTTTRAAENR